MAESHINSGISNRINTLNKHKQALQKQIQDIDRQINILTQAAKIMGEIDQLPKLRSQTFKTGVKTLIVQILKQENTELSANEITQKAIALDNKEQQPLEITTSHIKAVRMALNGLIKEGMVIKTGSGKNSVRYQWSRNGLT